MAGHVGRFVLLRDFHHAYDLFPLKAIDAEDWLESNVRAEFEAALRDACDELIVIDLDQIRARVEDATRASGDFIVTLDGGTYFHKFNFSFEITRTVFQLSDAGLTQFVRLPRAPKSAFVAQALHLRDLYQADGAMRPVLLCDDGIDTGDSLRELIQKLHQLGVPIDKILVLLNQHGKDALDDLQVDTIFGEIDRPYEWLSERDLYWGLPRSGLSFTWPYLASARHGIPYTIDRLMVERRIRISPEASVEFRRRCLDANIRFWEFLEQKSGRPLCFEDCDRLAFFAEITAPGERIVDYVERINHDTYRSVEE